MYSTRKRLRPKKNNWENKGITSERLADILRKFYGDACTRQFTSPPWNSVKDSEADVLNCFSLRIHTGTEHFLYHRERRFRCLQRSLRFSPSTFSEDRSVVLHKPQKSFRARKFGAVDYGEAVYTTESLVRAPLTTSEANVVSNISQSRGPLAGGQRNRCQNRNSLLQSSLKCRCKTNQSSARTFRSKTAFSISTDSLPKRSLKRGFS